MMASLRISLTVLGLFLSSQALGQSQAQNPLVGAWERFSLKDTAGVEIQPPEAPAFVVFSADGHYAQVAVPTGRPRLNKPFMEHTRDELVGRYRYAEGRHGKYTVNGSTLTRTYVANMNPMLEGAAPQVQSFKIEGDVLILRSPTPGSKAEARFRRQR
jgi:hypothetical protein